MKNLKVKFALFFIVMSFISCKQDPYPEVGQVSVTQTQEQSPVDPPLSIAIEDVIELREGIYREYPVRVSVKEPGVAEVSFDGLPQGAEYDPELKILKWRPSFFDGNEPGDPSIRSRIYPITIWLRSSLDPIRALKKTVNLIVFDSPQTIEILTENKKNANEGEKYSNIFKVKNADYPTGPFSIVISGFPVGTELIKIDENTFKVEFTPDYYHVSAKGGNSTKVYNTKIIVSNPANHTMSKDLVINVKDVRLSSKIVAPEELTQGLDVSFQVVSYDLNREISPELSISSSIPRFGNLTFKKVPNVDNNSTVLNVSWTDIPPIYNGEKFSFTFKSCVWGSGGYSTNCTNSKTTVNIVLRERKAPYIDRSLWPVGVISYLNFSENLTRDLKVIDAENTSLKPKVEIFPIEIRKFVSWKNNLLSLSFSEPGIFQFNVIATSDYNVSTSESFLIEVFPKDRNKILFFADSTRDPEVIFYKKTFKNVDIMNPAIQDVNLRNLSGRDTLVIGTSSLIDADLQPTIMNAIDKIKNVVVASPLINQLPEKFLEKMRMDYGLVTIGRYSQLPNLPPLEKMQFAKTSQFSNSAKPVFLKQTASSESSDPMLFNGGLYETQKICKGVLGLALDGINPYVIGVVCTRENGGRISLLGTEWADLAVTPNDEQIPVLWFNTMINGNF